MKIFLTRETAQKILNSKGDVLISPNLWYGKERIKVSKTMFDPEKLKKILKSDAVYFYDTDNDEIYKVALYEKDESTGKGIYCQLNVFNRVPVLTINGFRMHRVLEDPFKYVNNVIRMLDIKKDEYVLDTCMGLGYTAIAAAKKGAFVTTCEKYESVYEIAKINPWSQKLFNNEKITVIKKDVIDYLKEIIEKEKSFDVIIHDPPTVKFSPELYSRPFYRLIDEVSHPQTRLYHYFGDLTKKQNYDAFERARKQLKWRIMKNDGMGVVFVKP